jgi:CheY-like chemotaxis protein
MSYITQHHHTLRNQPFSDLQGVTVLLVEPEPEARSFYTQQLSGMDMRVVPCDSMVKMHNHAKSEAPDVIIFNPSEDIDAGIRMVKVLKQEFPALPLISMTMTMREDLLDAIMQSGVSFHINRGLTRPRDLLLALEQVLAMR